MIFLPNFSSKNLELTLDNIEQIQTIAHALSTTLRLKILQLIQGRGMSVNELARALDVPPSTVALNVQVLENAGLIRCDTQPGVRGKLKICDRRLDKIAIRLQSRHQAEAEQLVYEMPIGGFSFAGGVRPTCGMAAHDHSFNMDDSPAAFFHPQRFQAGILWMREGFVEYAFPPVGSAENLESIEFSFEACSEAPCYRNDWPSDIYVCVNGVQIGVWHCPGDFGGRRGRNNPDWWSDSNSQFGRLVVWRVSAHGTQLDGQPVSRISLNDLKLVESDYVSLRIGVLKSDDYAGGINLFGKGFGDYPQDILMRCILRMG